MKPEDEFIDEATANAIAREEQADEDWLAGVKACDRQDPECEACQ